jgi:hypothetical protein
MSLTSEESRRLDEIGRRLSGDDPALGRILSSGRLPRSRTNSYGRLLTITSTVTLTIGIAIQQPVVCGASWLGLLVGGLMMSALHLDLASTPGATHRVPPAQTR